ncbi:MAG TPA: CoA pyrophosphatase [Bacteroidota bacterium]|nr:CoA pyrophosphatase [Bacteroidota bacterium]
MPASIEIVHIEKFFSLHQRHTITNKSLTPASVLILLTENVGELSVLFTQRTETVEHHKGQISFPGGARDVTDATVVDTALRETEEEIGLSRTVIRILGIADDFETPSGFCMTPVVGFVRSLPMLQRSESEVADIFLVPISFFLDVHQERVEQRERAGNHVNIYFYQYQHHLIWGATAAILRSFLHAVRDTGKS